MTLHTVRAEIPITDEELEDHGPLSGVIYERMSELLEGKLTERILNPRDQWRRPDYPERDGETARRPDQYEDFVTAGIGGGDIVHVNGPNGLVPIWIPRMQYERAEQDPERRSYAPSAQHEELRPFEQGLGSADWRGYYQVEQTPGTYIAPTDFVPAEDGLVRSITSSETAIVDTPNGLTRIDGGYLDAQGELRWDETSNCVQWRRIGDEEWQTVGPSLVVPEAERPEGQHVRIDRIIETDCWGYSCLDCGAHLEIARGHPQLAEILAEHFDLNPTTLQLRHRACPDPQIRLFGRTAEQPTQEQPTSPRPASWTHGVHSTTYTCPTCGFVIEIMPRLAGQPDLRAELFEERDGRHYHRNCPGIRITEEGAEHRARVEEETARLKREKDEAKARAMQLFESHLTESELAEWRTKKAVTLTTAGGRTYLITDAASMNVHLLDEEGYLDKKFCLVPEESGYPQGDALTMQLLMLRSDEAGFILKANAREY